MPEPAAGPGQRLTPPAGVVPLLTVRALHAWYGESHILHGVDFDVYPGETVTLLGRNGAGKTTTLKSIMGMIARRQGSMRFAERELMHLPSHRIARLGVAFCPEERGIFASLTVAENLVLPHAGAPGWAVRGGDLQPVPESPGTPQESGHQALRRGAADTGDWPYPTHRGPLPAP
jgi:branched-chain amino acid transport system ATP-binding protein